MKALSAQPHAPIISNDPKVIAKEYKKWRIRMMYSLFIGYAVFYFTRKNLSAVMPALSADLHYSKTELGILWSGLYLSYGISKFANGVLGDKANPRYFMAIGLVLSALSNIFFGLSSTLFTLGLFWVLNGWFQGMGWPPCARSLSQWYSTEERGFTWGIWNASHQIGGAGILAIAGFIAQHYGWRWAFFAPALFAIAIAVFLVERLRDTPSSLGLPTIEEFHNLPTREKDPLEGSLSTKEILINHVFKNKYIWFIAIGNFFVYIVRFGAIDWIPMYLVEVKHASITKAGVTVAIFEILGIAGALAAGTISDKFFKSSRGPVNTIFMFLLCLSLIAFWIVPEGQRWLITVTLASVGFLVYGPQILTSVHAADLSSKHAAGSSTGFVGFLGYMGSLISGVGTGYLVDRFGWNGGFMLFIGSAFLGIFFFALTWNARAE